MKQFITRVFGLKGSWSWAKKQMLKGEIIRGKHWSGVLKFKIESKDNSLLQCCLWSSPKKAKDLEQPLWQTSSHHLSFEDFTDYEIVKNF